MVFYAQNDELVQKCYVTHGVLPSYVDERQLPQKRKPFSTIQGLKWSHTVHLILPDELHRVAQHEFESISKSLRYAKVMMSLGAILHGDFFNKFIKTGNILMLSEGRRGLDNIFSLHEGTLQIELDRATYERAGLVGQPIRDGGLKHKKNRFAIAINLRGPSMVHGKKGFERLIWACKHVFTQSLTWLFHDANPSVDESTLSPLAPFHPLHQTPQFCVHALHSTYTPPFRELSDLLTPLNDSHTKPLTQHHDTLGSTDEYFSLAALHSDRLSTNDSIDPYFARYEPPTLGDDEATSSTHDQALMHVKLHGFLDTTQLSKLLIRITKSMTKMCTSTQTDSQTTWFSMRVHAFGGSSASLLVLPPVTVSPATVPPAPVSQAGSIRDQHPQDSLSNADDDLGKSDDIMDEDVGPGDIVPNADSRSVRGTSRPGAARVEFLEWFYPGVL